MRRSLLCRCRANRDKLRRFAAARPVVQVGESGSTGVLEITDIIFSTRGPAAGAIVVEWNVAEPAGQQGATGTWDTHIILGGSTCSYAHLPRILLTGHHVAPRRGGHEPAGERVSHDGPVQQRVLRGVHGPAPHHLVHRIPRGAYSISRPFIFIHGCDSMQGMWVWAADHDIDNGPQINIWSGRGIMSESQGPVWMIGTASEHPLLSLFPALPSVNQWPPLMPVARRRAQHHLPVLPRERQRPLHGPHPDRDGAASAASSCPHAPLNRARAPPPAAVLPARPGAPRAVHHEHGVQGPRDRAGRSVGAHGVQLAGRPRLRCAPRPCPSSPAEQAR